MDSTALETLSSDQVWDTERAFEQLRISGNAASKRTAERRLHTLGLVPEELGEASLRDEAGRPANALLVRWFMEAARSRRRLILFAQLHATANGGLHLHTNDARGARYWVALAGVGAGSADTARALEALQRLQAHIGKPLTVFPHGELTGLLRDVDSLPNIDLHPGAYLPMLKLPRPEAKVALTPHLRRLEAEGIHIIREAVAEAEKPVMLYSVGKDSAVMLHLARKAFHPAPPPFPLLHVDTRWKFQEMYQYRDHMARASGIELMVHVNPEAIQKDINPFDHGSALHTQITKTEGLKQALDAHRFDVIFGGARRDEEKSRAKERIFSFRSQNHRWDPKNQRPELWNLYNTRKEKGESIRVFPLSNWTELDVWQYIYHEQIAVVPLYFARRRPVVHRDGLTLVVDDARFRLLPGEEVSEEVVRFRTLGCYPLTGAVASQASSVAEIILELSGARTSERQGRAIDADASASMERKKQEGYF